MALSLSTMWAQQDRFVEDMHRFVEETFALGYDAIEISHLTPSAPFERLMSFHEVPISSIHAPAPLVRDGEIATVRGTVESVCRAAKGGSTARRCHARYSFDSK